MNLEQQYKILIKWTAKYLIKKLHARHLEDCVQYIAMSVLASKTYDKKFGLQGRWDWYLKNYCRLNGLNNNSRSKQTAKTMELSHFVGEDTWKLDNNNSYNVVLEPEENGVLELLLNSIGVKNQEVMKWAIKEYRKKLL